MEPKTFALVVRDATYEMTEAARDYLVRRMLIMQFGEPDEYIMLAGATFTATDAFVLLTMNEFAGFDR